MKEWLRRVLPDPVIRVLKPVYRWFISVGRWARRIGRRFRRAGRILVGRDDTAVQALADRVDAVRDDRDAVKAELRRVRGELRKARERWAATERTREPSPDEVWEGQRAQLAGRPPLADLAYFPGGSQNPYLRLLYAGLPEVGYDPRPLGSYELLDRAPGDGVFHLHWTRVFQAGAPDEAAAREQTERGLARLEDYLGRGGRLVWSVHEWLPHDCEFPEVEVGLRRRLVELASGVHVLHASTLGEVEGLYPLDPERTFTVEHPLYRGVYPEYVTRGAARRLLGVDPDEVVLLAFGAIRPYKGFDRLVGLVPRLREVSGERVRVMVAGPVFKSVDVGPLVELAGSVDGVSMTDRAVPDEYVQVLFRAADVVVLPYRQVMNSGVLMLALSFGCPSVAPENPVTRDAVGSGLVHVFDRESDESLLGAVVEAMGRRGDRGIASDAFVARYDPVTIATQFAHEVAARITGDDESHLTEDA